MRAQSAIWTFTVLIATECIHKSQYNKAKMTYPGNIYTRCQGAIIRGYATKRELGIVFTCFY